MFKCHSAYVRGHLHGQSLVGLAKNNITQSNG